MFGRTLLWGLNLLLAPCAKGGKDAPLGANSAGSCRIACPVSDRKSRHSLEGTSREKALTLESRSSFGVLVHCVPTNVAPMPSDRQGKISRVEPWRSM